MILPAPPFLEYEDEDEFEDEWSQFADNCASVKIHLRNLGLQRSGAFAARTQNTFATICGRHEYALHDLQDMES